MIYTQAATFKGVEVWRGKRWAGSEGSATR
jgi:hypothetical protein